MLAERAFVTSGWLCQVNRVMTQAHSADPIADDVATQRAFPLSLLTLAAALEQTSSCLVVDGNVDRAYRRHRALLATERYDAVGLTVMGGPQVQSA